jgi:hypothetical protein
MRSKSCRACSRTSAPTGPRTTGTPISLLIENTDQRSKDYSDIRDKYRPGHADFTYDQKYGIRDYRGGGRTLGTGDRCARGGGCCSAAGAGWRHHKGKSGAGGSAQDRLCQFRLGPGGPEPLLLRRFQRCGALGRLSGRHPQGWQFRRCGDRSRRRRRAARLGRTGLWQAQCGSRVSP